MSAHVGAAAPCRVKNAAGTSTEQYAYDGEGERVWQQAAATSGGTTTTTTTSYVLGVQEWTGTAVTGQSTSTTTTSLYPLPGGAMATRDASGLTYQGSDALGTPVAALNASTGVVGEQLFAPYGQARYGASAPTTGGLHTTLGFTGQHTDTGYPAASGLDYFGARYLDPVVGQFASADGVYPTLHDPAGLDPYAYVRGHVESARDPSGHAEDELDEEARGFAPADGLAVDVPGASAAATAAEVPSVGGDTLTIEGPDGSTITYSDDGTQVTIHNAAGRETIEDNTFQAPTETFENQASAHAADAQASGTTATTPGEGPSSPGNGPASPGEGPATGEGPSTSSGASSPSVASSTPGDPASGSSSSPNFVVTPNGEAITIPEGATGPSAVVNPQGNVTGEAYTDGSGGNGLSPRATAVRIMDPTGRYPGGYVVYQNGAGQGINPFTGRTIPNSDDWRHIAIGL